MNIALLTAELIAFVGGLLLAYLAIRQTQHDKYT